MNSKKEIRRRIMAVLMDSRATHKIHEQMVEKLYFPDAEKIMQSPTEYHVRKVLCHAFVTSYFELVVDEVVEAMISMKTIKEFLGLEDDDDNKKS